MDKESWGDLVNFFKEPFDQIHDIKMLFFIDLPILFTFQLDTNKKMYAAYLLDLERENFYSKWLMVETDINRILELLKQNLNMRDFLIGNEDEFHFIEVDDIVHEDLIVGIDKIKDMLPSENLYLTEDLLNEVEIDEVYEELFIKKMTETIVENIIYIYSDQKEIKKVNMYMDRVLEKSWEMGTVNIERETHGGIIFSRDTTVKTIDLLESENIKEHLVRRSYTKINNNSCKTNVSKTLFISDLLSEFQVIDSDIGSFWDGVNIENNFMYVVDNEFNIEEKSTKKRELLLNT